MSREIAKGAVRRKGFAADVSLWEARRVFPQPSCHCRQRPLHSTADCIDLETSGMVQLNPILRISLCGGRYQPGARTP